MGEGTATGECGLVLTTTVGGEEQEQVQLLVKVLRTWHFCRKYVVFWERSWEESLT